MPATDTERQTITRRELAKKLNEDLAREYQAIIAYVIYSQVLKGAGINVPGSGSPPARPSTLRYR
jgi:hypothetical protein